MGFVFLSMIVMLTMSVITFSYIREFIILFFREIEYKAQKRRAERYRRLASL